MRHRKDDTRGRRTATVSRWVGETVAIQHSRKRKSRENTRPVRFFQLARRTRSQQLAQNQTQVERSYVDQLPFQNVLPPPQMAAPHTARLVAVREAAFDQLSRSSQ
jgi:hypothetical protein